MTLYIDEKTAVGLLGYKDAVDVIDKLFKDEAKGLAENFPTVDLNVPRGFHRTKVGAAYGFGAYGFKAYGMVEGGLPARFLISLYGTKDGALNALIDALGLSEIRTGAVSAVACRYMARKDAKSLGIIGTGREAFAQVAAIKEVRPIVSVKCWSRSDDNRSAFAHRIGNELGIEANPATSAEDAVRGVDIVVTASTAAQPVLLGEWLQPGQHICAIGATRLYKREIDVAVVKRAEVIAVESKEQAQREIGELVFAQHQRALNWAQVVELKDIASGTIPGRRSNDDITLVNTVGAGAEDIAIAAFVYDRAKEKDVGVRLPM